MGILSNFLNRRKAKVPLKNMVPEEKKTIRKTFGLYCHSHHHTSGNNLCPSCNALLATVMTKIQKCPYGITKPVCQVCDRPCFGTKANIKFREIMKHSQKRMFIYHPMLFLKQKLKEYNFAYAKSKQKK